MMKRLVGQLPPWMQAQHPMMRQLLERSSTDSPSARYTRALFLVILGGVFLFIGYANASNFFEDNPLDLPMSQLLTELLFWPAFVLQVGLQLSVLLVTINTVGEQKRRQTWDNLRATSEGAALALRTRWSAIVFYRMRGALLLLILVRVVLIVGLLNDLTAFEGDYLTNLTGRVTPDLPLAVSVLLLAFTMTASFLLPITTLGFDAAFGLLVSTFVQQRTYTVLAQIVLAVVRVAIIAVLVIAVEQFRGGSVDFPDLMIWGILLAFAAIGDWGLSFLYLGFYGQQVWVEVPNGILLGGALLAYVVVQAVLTDLVLGYAVRRAEAAEA